MIIIIIYVSGFVAYEPHPLVMEIVTLFALFLLRVVINILTIALSIWMVGYFEDKLERKYAAVIEWSVAQFV